MQCARCAGMRVPEVIVEGGARIFMMRCVHCGDVIDHVILTNRQRYRHARLGRPRTSIHEGHQSTWRTPILRAREEQSPDKLAVPDLRQNGTRKNQARQTST